MQTYAMAEVKTADKTTLTAYTRAERKAFDTTETFTVTCEGCGLVAKRNRYKWVPVDKTMVKSVCVIDETTRWACANCGPVRGAGCPVKWATGKPCENCNH